MGKTYTAKEIRSLFKDFFSKKGHHIVPSAKVVVKGDPTLLFCNAGMNQFKDVILGNVPVESSRVADSQKCIRVTGKHNDLEEVGRDTYHHTFFEMLGNWSFGDYFKKEAIEWAWEFLTEVLHLEKERLYATIFEGSPSEGLEKDTEAQTMWEAFLPKSHIVEGNKHDNFWEMGDVGPCGPCSEIHIDLRSDAERREKEGVELVNQGHPLVIEIWNLVFMQYNRRSDGSLAPLPKKVIDTGMGFERLCMAVQGKRSNYDTDVFTPILSSIEKVSGKKYGENEEVDIAMRVVADHIRSISFAIADGCLPSNQKAGYVIRRILRRAVRYAYTFLGQGEAFLYRLLPSLIESMGEEYTELREQRKLIENVIKEEEEAFLKTLASGIKLLERLIEECRKRGEKEISGKDTFMLYDTFGFPLDLTQLILQENNLGTNLDEFNQEMKLQKERARNSSNIDLGDWIVLGEGNTSFVGYDTMECKTKILRYRELKQKNQTLYQVVLSQTPFYAEKGGEVGDTGVLIDEEGKEYPITDTKNENNLSLHFLSSLPKNMEGEFVAKINLEDRESTACNHSATHLLHEALREVLGTHVEQKGSFVNAKTLRFDFSHFAKLTNEEIRLVERKVNAKIRRNIPLDEKRSIPIEEAKAMGAMALFSEKYGNQVRVIKFGSSVELCGGCHVKATGNIGMFKIVSESSSSAGIRRIEAITGKNLEELMYITQDTMGNLRSFLNNTPDVLQAVKKEIELNAELKHQVEGFFKMQVENLKGFILQNGRRDCGNTLVYELHGEHSTDMVKEISSQIRGELKGNFAFVATTLQKGKPSILVLLSEEAVRGGLNASTLVREGSKHIQGGGGGQPFLATAGGKNPEGLPMAFDAILNLIKTQG